CASGMGYSLSDYW
nr:immunoglobulin heavy chain junction region [Macaca mulatta]MOW50174.1 immunoglobulin heavy chain junction region [Macaca mulatta]MOW50246.1 immunoglobulin heavy chain junction region [Macaca mulatta]MOW50590.1 immunoglobulin heavy chain junction region [Macaca mulatta]MOW50997.1 immunoglobulin heavy chain junction region [Macaca mulatta]